MSFSLDTPSAASLKSEARMLREERAVAGAPLTQGAALEEVANDLGFRYFALTHHVDVRRSRSAIRIRSST